MEKHKDIVISGWRFVLVFTVLFIMAILAVIGLIAIVIMCAEPMIGSQIRWMF